MNEAETLAELIDPAFDALKQSMLRCAFRGELSGSKVNESLSAVAAVFKTSTHMVLN